MISLFTRIVLLSSLVVFSAACRSAPAGDEGRAFTFAFLVSGPSKEKRTDAERQATQMAHLANITRLAEEQKLLVAGPFGPGNPHPDARGIFIFATADETLAREWTNSDPAVQAGALGMELCTLRSSAPLERTYELDQRMREELRAAGQEVTMQKTIRGYVMLLGSDVAKAERALEPLRASSQVLFAGPMAGSERARYVAVLDAETVDAARALFGAGAEAANGFELVSWWATKALPGLAAVR